MASSFGYSSSSRVLPRWILLLLLWIITFVARKSVCAASCGVPGKPASGSFYPERTDRKYNVDDGITYTCKNGFTLFGSMNRQCLDNGTWSGSVPICEENVAIRKQASQYPAANSSLPTYRAVDGNRETYACLGAGIGRWIKVDLGSVFQITSVKLTVNADMWYRLKIEVTDSTEKTRSMCKDINEHIVETINKFVCNNGTSLSGSKIIITDTVTTSTPLYQTNPKDLLFYEVGVYVDRGVNDGCSIPDSPLNGRWDGSVYQCDAGYVLQGSNSNRCIRGVWSTPSPICESKEQTMAPLTVYGCGASGVSRNGLVRRVNQNISSYECQSGFKLVGNSQRYCQTNGSWAPTSLPKCVDNMALKGKVYQSDVNTDTKSVDGNPVTCVSVQKGKFAKRWWLLDLGVVTDLTNVTILLQSGSRFSMNVSVGTNVRLDSPLGTLPSFCHLEGNTATAVLSCRSDTRTQARYILIEMADTHGGFPVNFIVCEVQAYNYFQPQLCSRPDEPLNGVALNRSTWVEMYQYQCNNGYKLVGSMETKCVNGQWSAPAPVCTGGVSPMTTTTQRTTTTRTWPTTDPRSRNPTDATTATDTKEKDPYYAGIIGIAVGATVASVSIVLAIVIVVCLLKKHIFKHPSFNQGMGSVGYNRENSNSTTYRPPDLNSLRSGGGSNGNDYDYAAQHHVYDVIKPLEELLPGRYLNTNGEITVANDSYVNNSPNLHANQQRPRFPAVVEQTRQLPPPPRRQTPLYDMVANEELQPLADEPLPSPPPPLNMMPLVPPVALPRNFFPGPPSQTPSTAGTLRLTPQTTL